VLATAADEVLAGPERIERLFVLPDGLAFDAPAGLDTARAEKVYLGMREGSPVGFAVVGHKPGFQDIVQIIFGYDPATNTVLGMRVLESKETPGLGDKIFKDLRFVAGFEGVLTPIRPVGEGAGSGAPNEAELITGATISARVVVDIINERVAALDERLEAFIASGQWTGSAGQGGTDEPEADDPTQDLMRGVWKENPVLIQMLGLCPALAVTNTVANAIAMSAATIFVLVGSSLLISLLKNSIPKEVRISAYILIIATFVTVVDLAERPGSPDPQGAGRVHRPDRLQLHDPGAAGGLRVEAAGGPLAPGRPGHRDRVRHRAAHDGRVPGGAGQRLDPGLRHHGPQLRAMDHHDPPARRLLRHRVHPAGLRLLAGAHQAASEAAAGMAPRRQVDDGCERRA
jgi:Na+-translocating ferredoxin:NAD+ oxidoreductase RnfG subunit